MEYLLPVEDRTYRIALAYARSRRAEVADACSKPDELPSEARYWLANDGSSGFGVAEDGELIGVFSTRKGRGDWLLDLAVELGASHLDCFDGYLPTFYERHGFHEVRREPNWDAHGPDVVYMARA